MKKLAAVAVLAVAFVLAGCKSMNVQDRDLACAVNSIVADRCNKGEEASVEVCNIARLLAAKCVPDESKAKLFARLKDAMDKE